MAKFLLACLALVLVAAGGCNQASLGSAAVGRSLSFAPPAAAAPAATEAAPSRGPLAETSASAPAAEVVALAQSRRIIYTANFAVLVNQVDEALEATRKMAERTGGYVQSMKGPEIVIRVPSSRFNEVAAALAGVGKILSKEVSAHDVTESYADLEVRIKTAKAVLDEYAKLLDKSANVEEALKVEREIGRVRADIEQMETQMVRLANEVTYATLTIKFTPVPPAVVPPEFRVTLPVPWLRQLGLDSLLNVVGM